MNNVTTLANPENMQLAYMDYLPMAMLVVDTMGYVIKANKTALELCKQNEFIGIENNKISSSRSTHKEAIYQAIERFAHEEHGYEEFVLSSRNPIRLRLTIHPFQMVNNHHRYIILQLTPINSMYGVGGRLTEQYKLTKAELRIAYALAEGLTPNEIARTYHVSHNTVRAQLKSIFRKTNTQRQSQLVKLLISLEQIPAIGSAANA